MGGDYTRFTFDPIKGFSGVHKQQGRVSLDSEFNEFEEILDRRDRAEMYDTVGQAVYAADHARRVSRSPSARGGKLTIGHGRMYVDGILAECFGDMTNPANTNFDEHMNDLVGNDPLFYDQQPFFYSTPPFPALSPTPGVINLVYLDVWQREVTVFEDYRAARDRAQRSRHRDARADGVAGQGAEGPGRCRELRDAARRVDGAHRARRPRVSRRRRRRRRRRPVRA